MNEQLLPVAPQHLTKAGIKPSLYPLLAALCLCIGLFAISPVVDAQQTTAPSLVNINTADATTLAEGLKGIGQSRAEEIVRHREAYGRFQSMDELVEVKGIGQSTLDSNRGRITLE